MTDITNHDEKLFPPSIYIFFGFLLVITIIMSAFESLTKAKLLWMIPLIIVIYYSSKMILKWRKEKIRISNINKLKDKWGDSFCQWLIDNGHDAKKSRIKMLADKIPEWGEDTVKNLISRRIGLGLTPQMAALSLGKPTKIDTQEISTQGEKYRWVYGTPQKGALYIWFLDYKAYKIKFNKNIIQSNSIAGGTRIINNFTDTEETINKNVSRERIPDDVQIFVWQRDEGRCVKCGSTENLEFDHIIPVSKGGSNSRRNLQLLCQNCNRSKSAKIGG